MAPYAFPDGCSVLSLDQIPEALVKDSVRNVPDCYL